MLSWQYNLIESCTCTMTPRLLMRSALFRPAHSSSLLPAQPSYNALQHRHPKSSVAWLATNHFSPSKRLDIPCCVVSRWSDAEHLIWPDTRLIIASCSAVISAASALTPDRLMDPRQERNCRPARSPKAAAMMCGKGSPPPGTGPGLGAHGELNGAD